MKFYDKFKWIIGILMVFVLIIATNLIDRKNFVRVKDSVVTIYEDRLIANDLIFKMTQLVHEKEIALVSSDSSFFKQENAQVNEDFQKQISRFNSTKLTPEETKVFSSLEQNFTALKKSEIKYSTSAFSNQGDLRKEINNIKDDLEDLSKIQLSEGGRQMSISQQAIDIVELFTRIEIFSLVLLALVIQIIVMYRPKGKS